MVECQMSTIRAYGRSRELLLVFTGVRHTAAHERLRLRVDCAFKKILWNRGCGPTYLTK